MLVLAGLALGATPTAAEAWDALLAGGCAMTTVQTPFEARILRNVPYARGGHTFKDAALARFFADDGGWYTAKAAKVVLEGPALACVERLAAREKELQRTVPMSDALQAKMLRSHDAWTAFREWGDDNQGKAPYADVKSTDSSWSSGYPGCVPDPVEGLECGGYSVECPDDESMCITVAAG